MAGENNILDDFELDLDIETITLDDIDISEIDGLSESADEAILDTSIESVSLDPVSPESTLSIEEPVPVETPAIETSDPEQAPSVTIKNENIGAAETLNIINETPEPDIIQEREIKPVEEIRTEARDKTFDKENALEEAYVFNADDEIISIDGRELDEVIYGEKESEVIGNIEVVDQANVEEQEEVPLVELMEAREEELIEVSDILDSPAEEKTPKKIELETIDQDDNYELQMESINTTSLNIDAVSNNLDDEEEPIALSMDELNEISVSEEVSPPLTDTESSPIEEVSTGNMVSPLNDENDFSPSGSTATMRDNDTIDLGEKIEIPPAPTNLSMPEMTTPDDSVTLESDSSGTDVEELYSIYNGDNSIPSTSEEEILETSSQDVPDFSTESINMDTDIISSDDDTEIIEIDEDDLIVPLTEDYVPDDSILAGPFDSTLTDDELPLTETPDIPEPSIDQPEEHSIELEPIEDDIVIDQTPVNPDPVEFEPIEDELIEQEGIEPVNAINTTKISTEESELEEDENQPLEEEIAITQTEFIEMATLEEKENQGEINAEELDQVSINEPALADSEEISSETSIVPGMNDEIDTLGEEIIIPEEEEEEEEEVVTIPEESITISGQESADTVLIDEDIQLEEIELDDEISIDDSISQIETIESASEVTLMDKESDIIATAPDAVGNDTIDTLPVPGNIEEEHVEITEEELSISEEAIIAEENVNPEMYDLNNTQQDKELIINENVDQLSTTTKDEMKKVLNYLDNLLEDLPQEKIKEFSQSEYYDLYVKILDKLGV